MDEMDIVEKCRAEGVRVFVDKERQKIILEHAGNSIQITRHDDTEANIEAIEYALNMILDDRFYKSDEFKNEFNKQLEIAILATRGGGSGARAVRDTLLSLYNGSDYKADLSGWYNLDRKNRKALLYVLEHHTYNHALDIHEYLPQYADDFERMRREVE